MKLLSFLADLLYPPKCAFCGRLLQKGETGMCQKCERSLPYVNTAPQTGDFYKECASPLYYDDVVRESLLRYKFSGCTGYAAVYGRLMAECVSERFEGRYDLVSWVPLSHKRRRKRGYDQALLLAEETARCLGMKPVSTLKKVKNAKAQSGTGSAEKRRANIFGAYEVIDKSLVEGKRILLIDDIITTGATLSECARMLRKAGAEQVLGVTAARSRE